MPLCKNSKGGHKFPDPVHQPERHRQWVVAIKRIDPHTKKLWNPSRSSVVCADHFSSEDYKATLLGERNILQPWAVPSLHHVVSSERRERAMKRRKLNTVTKNRQATPEDIIPVIAASEEVTTDQCDSSSNCISDIEPLDSSSCTSCNVQSTGTQCAILSSSSPMFSVVRFRKDDRSITYYTGFENYEHFCLFFHVLGPATRHLGITQVSTSAQDQLFMTLIKLRLAMDDYHISILFGITPLQVSVIFGKWINFMFCQFKELDIWPSKRTVQDFMPTDFGKQYPTTRIIIDATECPIQKPSDVNIQSSTFSTYKNKNTLKCLVGCSPRGAVTFVSDCYGGCTSDRQIFERSNMCTGNDKFDLKDSIMADRGFMVQDLMATKNVSVNTPTMLKGKSQLEPTQVAHDRKVASKRIHIERVIGLAKTFKILTVPLSAHRLILGNRIIYVCFMIVNFKKCIVSGTA